MIIVTVPSTSESRQRDLHEFPDLTTAKAWLMLYRGDLERVCVYKAEKLNMGLDFH